MKNQRINKQYWRCKYFSDDLTNEELITIIKGILKTDFDLRFLALLEKSELETLVACIRERVDQISK
jgi:hypothetical protein